ncbi:MAG: c-type cytochrome biogenesis protein CcmI [Roseibium sp.]|uniref:c-type cytochrome biogenesis protein CcmI n=1 Tax=Roseibium sp. TaxID=1936156 RepID=UPI003D9C5720
MTLFWILSTAALCLCALWLAYPFLRKTEIERDETDAALSIYRDQADEIRRDLATGLISRSEFDAAQREIEVRALKAARNSVGGMSVTRRSPLTATVVVAALVAGSAAGYAWLGTAGAEDRPLAARKTEALVQKAQAGDIGSRIELLVETVKEHPDSFEDWWLLARSYAATGDNASAADAYRRAAELSENDPGVLSAYAEAMTLANGNKVPQAAKILFQQIRAETGDPRARYYLALAKAQAQDFDGALRDWAALAAESDPNAPWMPLVRRDIVNMARFTESDVSKYLPDASRAELNKAAGKQADADQFALLRRAAALDKQLEDDPSDYKGWQELAQIRAALGDARKARAAVDAARDRFSAAPFILSKLDATAADLGLDLIPGTEAVNGPSQEDITAVQSLSADEQAELIEGMVAGLAAKLDDNPDNPDGWVMLVRSYSHLGETGKAADALARASAHYSDNPDVLAKIKSNVAGLVE